MDLPPQRTRGVVLLGRITIVQESAFFSVVILYQKMVPFTVAFVQWRAGKGTREMCADKSEMGVKKITLKVGGVADGRGVAVGEQSGCTRKRPKKNLTNRSYGVGVPGGN